MAQATINTYFSRFQACSMKMEVISKFEKHRVGLPVAIYILFKRAELKAPGARVYAIVDNVFTLKNGTLPNPELVDQLGVYTGRVISYTN